VFKTLENEKNKSGKTQKERKISTKEKKQR
jgi:hypothetical protein